ncbi:MAG: T9SS type A sorting domain-containing protein [bacterium]|nr:T9SS type A sorting domain-containing protein [bacterium]
MNRILTTIAISIATMLPLSASAADIYINEVLSANITGFTDEFGENEDWLEIYNNESIAVDLTGYGLSDDISEPMKWLFPATTIEPYGHLLIIASGRDLVDTYLHSSFKINSAGESLILSDDSGLPLDTIHMPELPADISLGHSPDGPGGLYYFLEPTPGTANISETYACIAEEPTATPDPGFHAGPALVELSVESLGDIRYTLDGSVPTSDSPLYFNAILVDSTSALRARLFRDNCIPSNIITGTYIIGEDFTLPVICITTDPYNLWDDDYGIHAMGHNAEPDWPYQGANFWQGWERPADIEFFELDGERFDFSCGIMIHGGYSKGYDQKSFRLVARGKYGWSEIEYPFFGEEHPVDSFKRLIVRNTGQDFLYAQCRDVLAHAFTEDTDLENMATRPCIAYVNGMYWGYMNIRERIDKYFLESYYGVSPDSVDITGGQYSVIEGSGDLWFELYNFIADNDMSIQSNYDWVQTQMEVGNFAEYNVFNIFLAHTDWPHHNIKRWRPQRPDGRWRWYYFDLDHVLRVGGGPTTHNTLDYATNPDYEAYHIPLWATVMLNNLLKNGEFRDLFINYYCDHMNSSLSETAMMEVYDSTTGTIAAEIPRHRDRWDISSSWASRLYYVHEFIENRREFAIEHLMDFFSLQDTLHLALDVAPAGGGTISLTAVGIDEAWTGTYFQGVPINLHVEAAPGFLFDRWSGAALPAGPDATITLTEDTALTAMFVQDTASTPRAVINEINYHSHVDFDSGDWVELHNPGLSSLDLSGWVLKDDNYDHTFTFPENTILLAGDYLVVCDNLDDFQSSFPGIDCAIGDMDFSFGGNGDQVRLFNSQEELVDEVEYDDTPPWPSEPDGGGPTLELTHPLADNGLPEFWSSSITAHGTPGEFNSTYSAVAVAEGDEVPTATVLLPPWPNPFNPVTTISFHLKLQGPVRLDIFDVRGRHLETLINRSLQPGQHELTWRPDNLPSGLYTARLHTEAGDQSRKLVLLK